MLMFRPRTDGHVVTVWYENHNTYVYIYIYMYLYVYMFVGFLLRPQH